MSVSHSDKVFGEVRETGRSETINGIRCDLVKIHFPANNGDTESAKWKWHTAYRFKAPGWPECTIVGLAAAKRVIRGRTDPAVLNTLGIDVYGKDAAPGRLQTPQKTEETEYISVLGTIRANAQQHSQPRTKDTVSKKNNRDEL